MGDIDLLKHWHVPVPKDGMPTEQLIKSQHELWNSYFDQYTTVNKSAGGHPNIVKFAVTVDLAPMCKTSRHIDDLSSR